MFYKFSNTSVDRKIIKQFHLQFHHLTISISTQHNQFVSQSNTQIYIYLVCQSVKHSDIHILSLLVSQTLRYTQFVSQSNTQIYIYSVCQSVKHSDILSLLVCQTLRYTYT